MYFGGSYYYIVFGLAAFCAFHSYRRGTLNRWIWLIIFLPLIGSLIYLYNEVLSKNRGGGSSFNVQLNTPSKRTASPGNIRKLEEQVRFADTFNNRIQLADAYLAAGETEKAIELYKTSLTGAFAENEHAQMQLMLAYYEQQAFEQVVAIGKRIYKIPQFIRSKAHVIYAMALEGLGRTAEAESEFKAMIGRYSYFEQRYQYGLFLVRNDRATDAYNVFTDMLNEEAHLGQMEKRGNREWFSKAKDELRKLSAA